MSPIRRCRRRSSFRLVNRARFAGLAFTLALGAATLAPPAPAARACGMGGYYHQPNKTAPALLADALRHVERDRPMAAIFAARAVLRHRRANPEEKARAWAVIGWSNWQRGDHEAAIPLLVRGRALDAGAIDAVLARAPDTAAAGAVREALKRWA